MTAINRVLLLGGHGKVALQLTPLLLRRGWDVVSVVRNPAHVEDIEALNNGTPGKVEALVASLDDVKSRADADALIARVDPNFVVWSAGAGGQGGPARTYAIDRDACKYIVEASLSKPKITKFLMVSQVGSRRKPAPWMAEDKWKEIDHWNTTILPDYYAAKLDADEYFLAMSKKRRDAGDHTFQPILLRPGVLTLAEPSGKVDLGKTRQAGSISRQQVAIVADKLLARDDTKGWYDLCDGDEPVDEAIERVVRDKVDAVEGEDVAAVYEKYQVA